MTPDFRFLRDIRILIIEDDVFASALLELLLIRDWRTEVVARVSSIREAGEVLRQERIDVVLVDTESPSIMDWRAELAVLTQDFDVLPRVICLGTRPSEKIARIVVENNLSGYLLKKEIHYSLAGAAVLANAGTFVSTEGTTGILMAARLSMRNHWLELDGLYYERYLPQRLREAARLSLIYNIRRKDIAEEWMLSDGSVRETVSRLYQAIHLPECLDGEDCEHIFPGVGSQEIRWRIAQLGKASSAEKATVAFHLLTTPLEKVIAEPGPIRANTA